MEAEAEGGLKISVGRKGRSVVSVEREANAGAQWQYQDPEGNTHGPFAASALLGWFDKGFFSGNLPVRHGTSGQWRPLSTHLAKLRADGAPPRAEDAPSATTAARPASARGAPRGQTPAPAPAPAPTPARQQQKQKQQAQPPRQQQEQQANPRPASAKPTAPAQTAQATRPAPPPKQTPAPATTSSAPVPPQPSPNAYLHDLHRRAMAGEVDLKAAAEPKKKGKKGGGGGGGDDGDDRRSRRGQGSQPSNSQQRPQSSGGGGGGKGKKVGGGGGGGGGGGNFEHQVAAAVFKGCLNWRYIDLEGNTQGPFGHEQLSSWHLQGYLHDKNILMCGSSTTAMSLLKLGEPGTSVGVPDRASYVSLRQLLIRGCEAMGKQVPPAWRAEQEEAAAAAKKKENADEAPAEAKKAEAPAPEAPAPEAKEANEGEAEAKKADGAEAEAPAPEAKEANEGEAEAKKADGAEAEAPAPEAKEANEGEAEAKKADDAKAEAPAPEAKKAGAASPSTPLPSAPAPTV